jgi:hypothetical protein
VADFGQLLTVDQTRISDLLSSIDLTVQAHGANDGNIDTVNKLTARQSCGSTEALSAAYHDNKV